MPSLPQALKNMNLTVVIITVINDIVSGTIKVGTWSCFCTINKSSFVLWANQLPLSLRQTKTSSRHLQFPQRGQSGLGSWKSFGQIVRKGLGVWGGEGNKPSDIFQKGLLIPPQALGVWKTSPFLQFLACSFFPLNC